jgi:hypothetical protein
MVASGGALEGALSMGGPPGGPGLADAGGKPRSRGARQRLFGPGNSVDAGAATAAAAAARCAGAGMLAPPLVAQSRSSTSSQGPPGADGPPTQQEQAGPWYDQPGERLRAASIASHACDGDNLGDGFYSASDDGDGINGGEAVVANGSATRGGASGPSQAAAAATAAAAAGRAARFVAPLTQLLPVYSEDRLQQRQAMMDSLRLTGGETGGREANAGTGACC